MSSMPKLAGSTNDTVPVTVSGAVELNRNFPPVPKLIGPARLPVPLRMPPLPTVVAPPPELVPLIRSVPADTSVEPE